MSYNEYVTDVEFKAGDLSKTTFTREDEAAFEQWLVNYIAARDELSQQGRRGGIYLMFAWDFTYGPDGRLIDLSAHYPWEEDHFPSYAILELEGISHFLRERGVRFKLVFNKAGEEDDDRWQITTTHGGVWAARGKLVYGKRERIA